MMFIRNAGISVVAIAILATAAATSAAGGDLGPYAAGSAKDGYVPLPRVLQSPGAGPCYVRADVGYSWSADPGASWTVYDETFTGDANSNGTIDPDEVSYTAAGSGVANASLENTWLAEIGAGCGSGSRGLRAELMLGFRGERDFDGQTAAYQGGLVGNPIATPAVLTQDSIRASLTTTTLMANAYYDFGKFGRFVPYLGVGLGAAYHELDNVSFAGGTTTQAGGNNELSFAWALMAGVGVQITDRAILDVGYRYIDTGSVSSDRSAAGSKLKLDDLTSHEIKVGLRYHFGNSCCDTEPASFK